MDKIGPNSISSRVQSCRLIYNKIWHNAWNLCYQIEPISLNLSHTTYNLLSKRRIHTIKNIVITSKFTFQFGCLNYQTNTLNHKIMLDKYILVILNYRWPSLQAEVAKTDVSFSISLVHQSMYINCSQHIMQAGCPSLGVRRRSPV